MIARARAARPMIWAVTTGMPSGSSEVLAAGSAVSFPARAPTPGAGLGAADGLICGNSPAALPAPMSELFSLFRSGSGPIGTFAAPTPLVPGDGEVGALELDEDDVTAAVTCAVWEAVGGSGSLAAAGLACASTVTWSTVVAFALTGTLA